MALWKLLFVALTSGVVVWSTHAARVLVLPMPVPGHFSQGLDAGAALLEDGHRVWVLAPKDLRKEVTTRGMEVITYVSKAYSNYIDKQYDDVKSQFDDKRSYSALVEDVFRGNLEIQHEMCEGILSSENIQRQILAVGFNLAVKTSANMLRCLYALPYKYGIPYVTVDRMDLPLMAGVPGLPSFQPINAIPGGALINIMPRLDRIVNAFFTTMYYRTLPSTDGAPYVQRYVSEKPPISVHELASQAQMFFVISNVYCLDYPRVSAPNYIYLPGLAGMEAEGLSEDVGRFMSSAHEGVFFISFGETPIGRVVLESILQPLVEAVSEFDQKVLLQLDAEPEVELPPSVEWVRQVPQKDVLGHPNTVLFISHGGDREQVEAAYHGVPMISICFSDDTIYNGKRIEVKGLGKSIPLPEVTRQTLHDVIYDVTKNASYQTAAKRCSQMTRSLPSGKEIFKQWVGHVMTYGGAHLRLASADMPISSILMLDIIFPISILLGTLLIFTGIKCGHFMRKKFGKCLKRKNMKPRLANSKQQSKKFE